MTADKNHFFSCLFCLKIFIYTYLYDKINQKEMIVMFNLIDFQNWERKEHFEYYRTKIKCGYSCTVQLDVTNFLEKVKSNGFKILSFVCLLCCQDCEQ